MKKIIFFIIAYCMLNTLALASSNVFNKQNYLKESYHVSVTSNYDAMDVYGILSFLMQYSEEDQKWNYELAGLTWEEMSKAIKGNPEIIFTKLSDQLIWKEIDNTRVLVKLILIRKGYFGIFEGKYFKNMEELDCYANNLTSIDVSENYNLKYFDCYSNQLTNLDVSKNVKLDHLYCDENKLSHLDVSKNLDLKILYFGDNQLTSIELPENGNLEYLNGANNQLTELNLKNNLKLKKLYCNNNKIVKLQLSALNNLISLDCSNNNLTALDIFHNTKLVTLNCSYNKLVQLEISEGTNLNALNCSYNKLTQLNVSKNANLKSLYCYYNELSALDLSNNINLLELNCSYNQINGLDVSKNANLTNLSCYSNQLSSLTVSKIHKLYHVYAYENQLKFSTLQGDFRIIETLDLVPQATLQGGSKGYFELLDLSSEYLINGKITTYTWLDKATKKEVYMYASKGKFYASTENAGKTLICQMKNELFPNFILLYEVTIANTKTLSDKNVEETIPEGFQRVGKKEI